MKLSVRELVLEGLFAALITVGTFIRIPIGADFYTLQFLFTLLAGLVLGEKLGALAVGAYVMLGLLGVPVFAAGGGLGYLFKPTIHRLELHNRRAVDVVGVVYRQLCPASGARRRLVRHGGDIGVASPEGGVVALSDCIFVTGTGTDVGKTFVTALIVKKLRGMGINAGYYKFAASGDEIDNMPADAWHVKTIANLPDGKFISYAYKEAVSPHLAAQLESRPIELSVLERDFEAARNKFEFLVVEGSGGIICPLRFDKRRIFLADLVKRFSLPVIIVADAGLGAINATCLTAEYLRAKDIPTRGVVLNRFRAENLIDVDNAKMIAALTALPIIAKVPPNATEIFWEDMFWK